MLSGPNYELLNLCLLGLDVTSSRPFSWLQPLADHPDPSYGMAGIWGELMKSRDLVLLVALAIGLLLGVSMLSVPADSEMAQFFDHLLMSSIIAYGVVYCFFM
jgi:hypothetical protein